MKRASQHSPLDQLIVAARTDAPSPALLEEMKTLALLGKVAPDASLGLASTKSSLSVAAGGSGKTGAGLLGGGAALKAGVGFVSLLGALVGGVVLGAPVWRGENGTTPESSTLRATRPARVAEVRLAPPAADPRAAEPDDGVGRQEEAVDGQEHSTLPLPPVFDRTPPEVGSARSPLGSGTKAKGSLTHGARSQRFLAEAKLVDEARRALRTNAGESLRLTEQCAREFPDGAATTERRVVAMEALVRLDRKDEARARLSAFEQAHPNSFHLPYLRRLIAKDATGQ